MRTHWALFMAQGVIMLILGVIAVIWPQISTVAADIYIGWIFLLGGIVGLVAMFWAPSVPGFIVEGIFQIAAAIRYRDAFPDTWGWMVMSGIADLVLAGVIISGWPGTASALAARSLVTTVAGATR